jgi:hypothetical protein
MAPILGVGPIVQDRTGIRKPEFVKRRAPLRRPQLVARNARCEIELLGSD